MIEILKNKAVYEKVGQCVAYAWSAIIYIAITMTPVVFFIDHLPTSDFTGDGRFTITDMGLLVFNLFMAPGNYYAAMLAATPVGQFLEVSSGGVFSFFISFVLFSPFSLWLWSRTYEHGFPKAFLQTALGICVTFCVSIPIYYFLFL